MDDLQAILDGCQTQAGASLAALIGRDGLVIDSAADASPSAGRAPSVDLALAAAEATEAWTVADRLHGEALGGSTPHEIASFAGDVAVWMRRLATGDFVLLVLPAGVDGIGARAALDAAGSQLEEALA